MEEKNSIHPGTVATSGAPDGGPLPRPRPKGSVAEQIDWTYAAEALCEAIDARAKKLAQALADEVFEGFLYNVQDYLRENIAFNLGDELKRAKQSELEANSALRSVAEALGVRAAAWPHSPTIGQVRDDALAKIALLQPGAEMDPKA